MNKKLLLKITMYSLITASLATIYFFGFTFLKNESQSVADREASINNQISQIEQSIDDKKQAETVVKMSNDINAHFLKSSGVPKFLSDLESIGGRTGSIVSINSVDESETELALGITANGSYQSIYRTLVELENIPYWSNISNMSLSFSHNNTEIVDFKKKPALESSWSLVLKLIVKSYSK